MSRLPHIYTPDDPTDGIVNLPMDAKHHLSKVLRAHTGFNFISFNGEGQGWLCEVIESDRKELIARVVNETPSEPEPAISMTICVGVVKGSRMDWAVEKAAETGVIRFIPLITEFSVVEPGSSRLKRWQNIAVSAAKQSRRLRIMQIDPLVKFEDFLNDCIVYSTWALNRDQDAKPFIALLTALATPAELTLLIGPEGGFSKSEIQAVKQKNIQLVSLGTHYLRTETAVAAAGGIASAISSEK